MKHKSAVLVNLSVLLYVLWLLIPAAQTTGGALFGAACVGLFALGVLLDFSHFRKNWKELCLRALLALGLPLILRRYLDRGGENFLGFYVQQVMFWFPLIFAGYARQKGDRRLWKNLKWVLLGAVVLTLLTTTGWLIQGMLRGGRVYAYSRSLGYAGEGREAYLKELMLRNIGGYDFVYAMAAAMPLTCLLIGRAGGWKRALFGALLLLQTAMILLSQYTYAMLFALAVLSAEGIALLIRKIWKLSLGKSLLCALTPFALAAVFAVPLFRLAAYVCGQWGLTNFAYSFEQLLLALQGQATGADSRMGYYLCALRGFAQSPLVGDVLGDAAQLSRHSDLMDLLSGVGLAGSVLTGGMVAAMGRGSLRGLSAHPQRAQVFLSFGVVALTALLSTVVYSRDISAVVMLGVLLILEGEC